jgi:adenylate cyclase
METAEPRSSSGPLEFVYPPTRVRAFFGGTAVGDSSRPLLLLERGHRPVYYFPMDDVRMDLMQRTEMHTHCPRKGEASYWTIQVDGERAENAAWSYLNPIPQAREIRGYVAFYKRKLDSLVVDAET